MSGNSSATGLPTFADIGAGVPNPDLGSSQWMTVTQSTIQAFADTTGDHQWIHVDVARAADGPFGSTIAHGFLVLSLISTLLGQIIDLSAGSMVFNYGLDHVRFTAPVPSGSEVRLKVAVGEVKPKGDGTLIRLDCEVELRRESRPALVAEFMVLSVA